jgi:hypothetical protein
MTSEEGAALMEARIKNPVISIPSALEAMERLLPSREAALWTLGVVGGVWAPNVAHMARFGAHTRPRQSPLIREEREVV